MLPDCRLLYFGLFLLIGGDHKTMDCIIVVNVFLELYFWLIACIKNLATNDRFNWEMSVVVLVALGLQDMV
jgi:hypothetical protein